MIRNISFNTIKSEHNNKNIRNINYSNSNVYFGNKISIPETVVLKKIERAHTKVEGCLRRALDKLNILINHKKIDAEYDRISKLDENSPKYIYALYQRGKEMACRNAIEINVEDGAINDIVKSDEACIFIMNHDKQRKDPMLLGFFNAILNREYILNDKAQSCPRPKVILNQDILNSSNPKSRAILEKLGSVGVDANLFSPDLSKNSKNLFSLLRGFIKNKTNVFVFPEGKMCIFDKLDLEYKFQTGIAELVNSAAKLKDRVKVVPLGFAYNKKNKSIFVGKPIYFKRVGDNVSVTKGNIDSTFAQKGYTDFFSKYKPDKDDFTVITSNGKPVTGKDLPDYIAGLMCQNLSICKKEAGEAISKKRLDADPTIYEVDL